MNPSQPLPWHGQAYSVKRFGIRLTDCDSEPVQTPGCVQSHGALLVLRTADLTIAQISENCADLLGTAPAGLLGRPLHELVGPANAARLQALLQQPEIDRSPSYVFTHTAAHTGLALDATVHTVDGVAVLEF
jgi:light-regulated signal transduction histidine kinase (bacteriophytochrome)